MGYALKDEHVYYAEESAATSPDIFGNKVERFVFAVYSIWALWQEADWGSIES